MLAHRMGISLPALLALSLASVRADPGIPELVPKDAAAALFIRDITEFGRKADKLAADIGRDLGLMPSSLVPLLLANIGVDKGAADKGAIGVVLPNREKAGDGPELRTLVFAVPFSDLDAIAGNFGLAAGELKPDSRKTTSGDHARTLFAKGRHLLLGESDKAVANVAETASLRGALEPVQLAVLDKADVALHLTPESWGPGWKRSLDDQEARDNFTSPAEKDGNVKLVRAMRRLRSFSVGLRLDAGLELNAVAAFRKAAPAVGEDLLSALAEEAGASDLAGLPAVDPLVAYAAKGSGGRNLDVVRALFREFFGFIHGGGGVGILAALDSPEVLGAFDGWYKQIKGSRGVVYINAPDKADKLGAVAVAGILDTDDPESQIATWTKLSAVLQAAMAKAGAGAGLPEPKVTFRRGAETVEGIAVHVQTVEFAGLKESDAAELRKILGPDWNKMRLAVHGRHVVWTVGSDTEALSAMLRNLKTEAKGLADHKAVAAAAAKLSPGRRLEIYVSAKNGAALADPSGRTKPGPLEALSAAGIAISPEQVQSDIWIPVSELKAAASAR